MTPLKIAVAGAGYIGLAHIEVLARSNRCSLSAIVDPSPSAVAIAAQAGVPLYTSLDALLTAGKPDGIILATPNHLHVPQALQCIAAGLGRNRYRAGRGVDDGREAAAVAAGQYFDVGQADVARASNGDFQRCHGVSLLKLVRHRTNSFLVCN